MENIHEYICTRIFVYNLNLSFIFIHPFALLGEFHYNCFSRRFFPGLKKERKKKTPKQNEKTLKAYKLIL